MSKFKNYAFWVALASAVVLFLDDLTSLLQIDFDTSIIQSVILSFCGVLVVLGIVNKKNSDESVENIESDIDNTRNNVEEESTKNIVGDLDKNTDDEEQK